MALNRLTNITSSGLGSVHSYEVAGVVAVGVITASSFSGNITGDIVGDVTGNADTATTATTLADAANITTGTISNDRLPAIITKNLIGNVTGNTSGTAGGLTGSPSIIVTDITAAGNVSIAGTLTYEDVTSVDAVGLSTFQAGIHVTGGSVGIGTDTPGSTKLKIESSSGTRAISLNAPTNGTYITFETAGTAYADIGAEKGVVGSGSADTPVINARGSRDLAFRTNSNERLRITSTGDLILGPYDAPGSYTTAANNVPYSIKVAPYGWQHHSELAAISMGNHSGSTGNDDGEIVFKTTQNAHSSTTGLVERLRITSDGKVMMGQSSSSINRNLSITGVTGNSNDAEIGLQPTNSSGGLNPETIIGATADGAYGAHMFFTTRDTSGNRTERFRITSDGKIGLQGNTTPVAKLHIGTENNGALSAQTLFVEGAKTGYANYTGLPQNQLCVYDNTASTAGSGGAISFGANCGSSQQTWIAAINSVREGSSNDASNYAGGLAFWTRPAQSTPLERMRITNNGLTFNGDTAAANALDDYEEGSWTPIISGTSGGNYTAGSGNVGRYTKVGRMVTASATLHWTSASYSGFPYIGGLPFATNSVSGYRVAGIIPGQNVGFYASGSYNSIKSGADWGLTYAYIVQANETISSGGNYNHSPTLNSSGNIYGFTITYQTD